MRPDRSRGAARARQGASRWHRSLNSPSDPARRTRRGYYESEHVVNAAPRRYARHGFVGLRQPRPTFTFKSRRQRALFELQRGGFFYCTARCLARRLRSYDLARLFKENLNSAFRSIFMHDRIHQRLAPTDGSRITTSAFCSLEFSYYIVIPELSPRVFFISASKTARRRRTKSRCSSKRAGTCASRLSGG